MTARELDDKDKQRKVDCRIELLESQEGSGSFGIRHSPTFKLSEPPSSERQQLQASEQRQSPTSKI